MVFISSVNNPAVTRLRSLKKRATRQALGLAFVEGQRFVSEALDCSRNRPPGRTGLRVKNLYVSDSFFKTAQYARIKEENPEIEPTVFSDGVFLKISDTMNPQGVLAVVDFVDCALGDLYDPAKRCNRVLILNRVADPGNAGAMIRTAQAAAFSGVVMSEGCVDLYEPKTLRATMGAVFRIPILRGARVGDVISCLRADGFKIYASGPSATPGAAATNCYDACVTKGDLALVIGSEAHGIEKETLKYCDEILSIPMPGGAESLNAGVAAGVLIYEILRRDLALKYMGDAAHYIGSRCDDSYNSGRRIRHQAVSAHDK